MKTEKLGEEHTRMQKLEEVNAKKSWSKPNNNNIDDELSSMHHSIMTSVVSS